jgi:aryl-alcohol dehydrogenase-like predicted oxidoreductase
MAFFAHSPLARGFLTGKYSSGYAFTGTDTRKKSDYFTEQNFLLTQHLFSTMREISKKYRKPLSQVGIRWILENPCVTSAIVGFRNISQVEDIVGSASWKLCAEDLKKLSKT